MNPKKHSALMCLIQGMSPAETARNLNVRPNTISRWLAEPEFSEQLQIFQQKALEIIAGRLAAMMPEAIQCLHDLMVDAKNPPSVRVNAAKALVDRGVKTAEVSTGLRHRELEWQRKMTLHAEEDAKVRQLFEMRGFNPQYQDWTQAAGFLRKLDANKAYWEDRRATRRRRNADDDDDLDSDYDDDSLDELLDVLSHGSVDNPLGNTVDDPVVERDEDYMARWRDRIVRTDQIDIDVLMVIPNNWRNTPNTETPARNLPIVVNEISGHIVDGHARAQQYLNAGKLEVTVDYVRLSEEEEKEALAALAPGHGVP